MGNVKERVGTWPLRYHGANVCSLVWVESRSVLLVLAHGSVRAKRDAWRSLVSAHADGFLGLLRLWVRRYASHVKYALQVEGGGELLTALLDWDPEGWRPASIASLPEVSGVPRATMLSSLVRHADDETVDALAAITVTTWR